VRRPRGEAYESRYLKPTFKSGRSSIGVWGSISQKMKGPLLLLPSKTHMDSKNYCDKVLNKYGHPFYEKVAKTYGNADDGAKYHTSKMVQEFWPAQSPGLNPSRTFGTFIKSSIILLYDTRGRRGNLRNITIIKNAGNYGKINVVT